ncbi:MAG: glycosyltransferase family 4 protein [bacterium]|nr:glycosyltransferase family 4 protein [bacterium]
MPLRVLIITTTLVPKSGWGTFARNTVLGLQERGHTVAVLVHEKSDDMECAQYVSLPWVLSLLGSPFAWVKTVSAIRKAIKAFHPDVIHIQVEPYALAMPFAGRTPWALSLNGTYCVKPLYSRMTKYLMTLVYKQAHHIFSPSMYTKKRCIAAVEEQCGTALSQVVEQKITTFKLGIELCPPLAHSVDADERHVLYVGGIKPRKGIAEIIEGFASYAKNSDEPTRLHLVGTNDPCQYRDSLHEIIEGHGLTDSIIFHGMISQEALEELYGKADVFIMLSKSHEYHFEGFGLVFLEANMRGIPTIGSRDSGCAEAVDEGVSGYSVDHDDPEMIAKRLQWILDEKRIDSADCVNWAHQHSIDGQVQEFLKVYNAVQLA